MIRLLSYYGDDFTGSTDVMEALASHGVQTALFTRIPSAEELAPYMDYPAIGIAGSSRSQTPEWMDAHLPNIFRWLKTLDARFCHYKVCSTFDSAPHVGSIGRAIDIAAKVFEQPVIPLIAGVPQLKRYTFAGHLFAGYQGQTYRIDRHPVMSRHPVTPMDEADLRLHLARQIERPVRLASAAFEEPGVHLIDVHDAASQLSAGHRLLSLPATAQPFVCGSSGVQYALVRALMDRSEIAGKASFDPVPPVKRMIAVSGSVSPTTERQIRYSLAHGFTGVEADPVALMGPDAQQEIARLTARADAILAKGGCPLVYTALGPSTDRGQHLGGDRSAIGRALGQIARECMARHGLTRLVIAGGDSSSHALAELDVARPDDPLSAGGNARLAPLHGAPAKRFGLRNRPQGRPSRRRRLLHQIARRNAAKSLRTLAPNMQSCAFANVMTGCDIRPATRNRSDVVLMCWRPRPVARMESKVYAVGRTTPSLARSNKIALPCPAGPGAIALGGSPPMSVGKFIKTALAATTALCGAATVSAAGEFDGVTVNILTRPGPVIAGRMAERGKEFEAMTGAKIVVTEVPFAEIFQKIQTDWTTGTNSIDVGVFAAGWGVELDAAGLLENLDPYIAKDTKIDLADIAPYFREFGQKIGGKTKLLMVDGDFQMVYYRKDVLEAAGQQPPKTWEDYIDVAKAIHGKDMNGDGTPDYGSCIFKKRNAQSYFAIQTVAASMVQTKGTAQGFHFDGATMKPVINNEAWKKAFTLYKETGKYGPPEELNMDIGDTRGLFKAGRCGLLIEWGDPGPMQIEKDATAVNGKLFAIAGLGSREVLDRATGKLVPVTKDSAPYAVDGVNYAPFAAFGGWAGGINAKIDPKKKAAAYAFLSYMNQAAQSNVDVTIGWTGYNCYRNSQLKDTGPWIKAGFSKELAENYLGAINGALNNPNMASDFKIPGAAKYSSVVLDGELARYLAGEITVDEALKNIETGWEETTEDFGRDKQIKSQSLALGG